jgi:hypothetical protein
LSKRKTSHGGKYATKMKIKRATSTKKTKAGSLLALKRKQNGTRKPHRALTASNNHDRNVPTKGKKRDNVDAWDEGAKERQEYVNEKRKFQGESKRLKFEPAPATFQLPTREEQLRKKMGDFAGPLLGTLWEAETSLEGMSNFLPNASPVKVEEKHETKKPINQFSELESSDEEEEKHKMQQPTKKSLNLKPASLPDPAKLKSLLWNKTSAAIPSASAGSSLFKPASFNADELLKQQHQAGSTSTSSTLIFRPPTFRVGAFSSSSASSTSTNIISPQNQNRNDPDFAEL